MRSIVDDRTSPDRNTAAGREATAACAPVQTGAPTDEERLEGLTQLRDIYVEAQELAVRGQPHENLDWILGERRDLAQNHFALHSQRIELISLWLEDLVVELESSPPDLVLAESESRSTSAHEARYAAAQKLREATELYLKLFRPPQL